MGNQWREEQYAEEEWNDEIDEREWERREQERRKRRLRKREEMRRKKRRQRQIRRVLRLILPLAGIICILLLVRGAGRLLKGEDKQTDSQTSFQSATDEIEMQEDDTDSSIDGSTDLSVADSELINRDGMENQTEGDMMEGDSKGQTDNPGEDETATVYVAQATQDTAYLGNIFSTNAVFIDLEKETIVAQKDAKTIVNPASMTKILTILVAAEHITDWNDKFTITQDLIDYCFVNDCSNVGFEADEVVTIKDLFYGTVLPSGADAAIGLAVYVAGSHEAFVDMMNEKLEKLGLSETAHFTNCVGVYDERHYCTLYDMAIMMKAAMDNERCREVLSTKTYTTTVTKEHPEGITISNWFLRRIEDKDAGGEVIGGKTGYVVQSGSCAASFGRSKNGKEYICVTGNANSQWRCIEDHADIYKQYME